MNKILLITGVMGLGILTSIGIGAGALAKIDQISSKGIVGDSGVQEIKNVSLSVTGSSTVFPIWQALQEPIVNAIDGYRISLNVSSTGSGNGVKSIKEASTNIGNASRDPKSSEASSGWENIRTFKLATDAITMYLKLPSVCNDQTFETTPEHIVRAYTGLSAEQIQTVTGISNDGTTILGTNVLVSSLKKPITVSDITTATGACGSAQIVLFSRNTTASGTRDGFLNIAKIASTSNIIDDDLFGEIIEARINDGALQTTNEANASAKTVVDGTPSGGTYLSYGFVNQETDETTSTDSTVVPSIVFSGTKVKPTEETILNGEYNWTRNLNSMIRINDSNIDPILKIIEYITISDEGRNLLQEVGFIPVQKEKAIRDFLFGKRDDLEVKRLIESGSLSLPWLN